jgi:uridylate kinase
MKKETIIMSLGGSIIVPDHIDIDFLKKFRELILKQVKKGKRFFIVCGGGRITRNYQYAASKITKLTRDDLDWLGIHSTRLNAHLLRTIFRRAAHPVVIKNPTSKIQIKKNIAIAAGWKPGFSTDHDAVLLAKKFRIKTLINISNINFVYNKDPTKHRNAKPLKEISWKKFRKIVGNKWDPGLNLPFDPVASKEAEKLGLKVIIMGNNLKNLENFLNKKKFKGTIICNQ